MCFRNCTDNQKKWWSFGVSFFVLLFALIIGVSWPRISSQILYNVSLIERFSKIAITFISHFSSIKQFVLRNGSRNYDIWMNAPVPIFFEIFLFNWTNPEQIRNHEIKPNFVQMGPYTFLEKHERVNLRWNNNNTVTFNQKRTWHFIPEMSNGTLDDKITNINVISAVSISDFGRTMITTYTYIFLLQSVAYQMRNEKNLFVLEGVNLILNRFGSFLYTKTTRELLFEGFSDPVLQFLKNANISGINLPDKFGWFANRNESATYDGTFVMTTGTNSLENMGYVTHWNNLSRIPYYKDECGKINGTTGELWPPIHGTPDVTIFVPDICRGITLKYDSVVNEYDLLGLKWIGDDRVFDNGKKYKEASCWCSAKPTDCPDLPPGVFNISACKFNSPSFVSYPHFYLADSQYLAAVNGLYPNRADHEFYLSLEPITGIPLEVKAQLQINILIQPSNTLRLLVLH